MMKLTELQKKEVMDLQTGEYLGIIRDFEIDAKTGKIQKLMVSHANFLSVFHKPEDIILNWGAVRKIGTDLIFVVSNS